MIKKEFKELFETWLNDDLWQAPGIFKDNELIARLEHSVFQEDKKGNRMVLELSTDEGIIKIILDYKIKLLKPGSGA